jgi:NADH-quinone oxidoreductase subunit E
VNELLTQYPDEIAKILAKYPADQKRAAVMPLLYLAQRQEGYITRRSLAEIGEICGVSITDVASIVGFYTLYHDEPGGKVRLQVCTDVACAMRGADEYLNNLCAHLGIHVGETTPDGFITVEEVKCLAACDHAPMFQAQTGDDISYHENQTVDGTLAWIETLREHMKGGAA